MMNRLIFATILSLGTCPIYAMNSDLGKQDTFQDLKSSVYPQLLDQAQEYSESSDDEDFDFYESITPQKPNPLLDEVSTIQQNLTNYDKCIKESLQSKNSNEATCTLIKGVYDTIKHYCDFLEESLKPSKYILTSSDSETIDLEIQEVQQALKTIHSLEQEKQKEKTISALPQLQEITESQLYQIQDLKKTLSNLIIMEQKQQCRLYDYLKKQAGEIFNERDLLFSNVDFQLDQLQTTIEEIIENTAFLLLDSQEDFGKFKKEPKEHFSKSITKVIDLSKKYPKKYTPYIMKFYIERQLDYYISKSRICNENIETSMEKWLKYSTKYADLMECFLLTAQVDIGKKAPNILRTLMLSEVATPKIEIFLKNGYDSIIKRYKNSRGTTTRLLYQLNLTNSNTRKVFETFSKKVTKNFNVLCSSIDYNKYKEACEKQLDVLDNEFKETLYEGTISTVNAVKNAGSYITSVGSYLWSWGGKSESKI